MYFHIITSAFYLPRQKMPKFEGWYVVLSHVKRRPCNHMAKLMLDCKTTTTILLPPTSAIFVIILQKSELKWLLRFAVWIGHLLHRYVWPSLWSLFWDISRGLSLVLCYFSFEPPVSTNQIYQLLSVAFNKLCCFLP